MRTMRPKELSILIQTQVLGVYQPFVHSGHNSHDRFGDSDREERHRASLRKLETNYVQGKAIRPNCFPIAFARLA